MKKKIIVIALLLIAVISSGIILDGYAHRAFNEKYSDNSPSALLDVLGELRYTAAALLWMKVDYYHHEYEFQGKKLTQNEPIMPLIRLITLLDPHFVQAYDFGAFHLAVDLKRPEQGMKFLAEGVANNPNSFDLNWEYGFLLSYSKKYEQALPYLFKARELREQKTPVYSEWLKVVWVNSRISKALKALGRDKEAEFYDRETKLFMEMENARQDK